MISDFSSILELAAAMNATFVVVECSRSFSKQLYENAFKFDSTIESKLKPQNLIDEETLKELETVQCGTGHTSQLMQKIRRDREKLLVYVSQKKEELKIQAKGVCELKTQSGLSLLNSLFCIFMLFMIPIEMHHPVITQYLLLAVSGLVLLAQIICWLGDAFKWPKLCVFNSLIRSVKWSVSLFLIGLLVGIACHCFLAGNGAPYVLIGNGYAILQFASAILPFFNFIIFTYITYRRLHKVRKEILNVQKEIEKTSGEINGIVNKMAIVSEVSHMLQRADE